MTPPVRHTPEGYHAATTGLIVPRAGEAIEFYRKALGARESFRLFSYDGRRVVQAEIVVGDTRVLVLDEDRAMASRSPSTLGGSTGFIQLYVPDVDAAFKRAVGSGATSLQPPTDMFSGDRCARVLDPFGHEWVLATHREDLSPKEKQRRLDEQSQ
jgi:PhnB protein